MDLLKLAALDKDDLDVISAYLQDSVLTVGDLRYLPKEQRFVITLNRFVWEKDSGNRTRERRRSAVHFDRVVRARSSNVRQNARDAVLSLLSVRFDAGEDPVRHD